ncbi:hypothetical protein PsYK624_054440 [Phanerochaete sordida]|uniref:Glycoside hydrolase family 16 protein n=1 Tax=Phanerochaete sordida TaxID=48140 RepID=A0A9P3G7P1_9APHY|nr:hypothetical protein PsYK624_054440 [Phanerochaete sordida]
MSNDRLRFALFTALLLSPPLQTPTFGALLNVTVDDQGTDPTTGESIGYEGSWQVEPGCFGCQARPDGNQAYGGTWHDTEYDADYPSQHALRNVTFTFTGTAIYAFGMIDGSTGIDLVFYLDGEEAAGYTYPPSDEYDYKYNQTYFQMEGLTNTSHSWKMQNGRWMDPQLSIVLFDYLVYTRDDGTEEGEFPRPSSLFLFFVIGQYRFIPPIIIRHFNPLIFVVKLFACSTREVVNYA